MSETIVTTNPKLVKVSEFAHQKGINLVKAHKLFDGVEIRIGKQFYVPFEVAARYAENPDLFVTAKGPTLKQAAAILGISTGAVAKLFDGKITKGEGRNGRFHIPQDVFDTYVATL